MHFLVHSHLIPDSMLSWFDEHQYHRFSLPDFSLLSTPIASHPDMLLLPIEDRLYCHELYYQQENVKPIIDEIVSAGHFKLITTIQPIEKNYPNDILFNGLVVDRTIIGRLSNLSKKALAFCQHNNYSFLNTKQGYARCSTCMINKQTIITADPSLIAIFKELDIESLKISDNDIVLPGLSKGFIGGSTGVHGNRLFICGNLDKLADAHQIRDFCYQHKTEIVSLSDDVVTDYGGLLFFDS